MSKRIHPEDPRITAHALGELSRTERAEIERAALLNPAVQEALDEASRLAGLLGNALGDRRFDLGDARREAIRRAGRHPGVHELPSARPLHRWGRPLAVISAAAALVVGGLLVLQEIPVRMIDGGNMEIVETEEEAMMQILLAPVELSRVVRGPQAVPAAPVRPAEGEDAADITKDPEFVAMTRLLHEDPDAYFRNVREAATLAAMRDLARLPELKDNDFVSTRDTARTRVPIVSGGASHALVERFVRGEERLPPLNAVRIEELVNHVVYRDDGDAQVRGVRLGAELVRCPWDKGRLLLGVLLRNDSNELLPLSSMLQLEVKPDVIRSYRLVGYADAQGGGTSAAISPEGLPPGWSNFVLYELTPAKSSVFMETWVVLRVVLQIGEGKQRRGMFVPVASPPKDWINASANFKTASVLAGYGLLLRDSGHRGGLDARLLTWLGEQALEDVSEGDLRQREALQLVIDSQSLLERREAGQEE